MRTILRILIAAFLGWHLGLLFAHFAAPWFLALAAASGWIGGAVTRRLRWFVSLALAVLAGIGVLFLMTIVPQWLAGHGPSPLDTIPLWADRQLPLALIPFTWFWCEAWLCSGRDNRRGGERLSHAAAVILLFWSQGPYHITIYPHPLEFALAMSLFLLAELLLALEPIRIKKWVRPLAAAAGLLVLLLGAGAIWGLFIRYQDQSTASGGGLMKPDLFQFDFAPLIRLEDQISLGDNLVLLYREEGTPRTRYLRRMVLDSYNPATGFSIGKGKVPVIGRLPLHYPAQKGVQERTLVAQEYYLVNLDPSSLLTLNQPVAVNPYAHWNQSSFVNAYRVDSLVSSDSLWLYNDLTGDGLSPEEREYYLQGGNDPEIRKLAESMTVGAKTPYEKATSILLTLKDHYYYSLKPGPPGPRGALKHFLFENKKGYCSYFAFGMTLLLRSIGVPARIAVGFVTNPEDSVLGFTPVRAFQAHAWVEVPFGPYGWLEFDPTSETPAPGENFQVPRGTDPQVLSKLIAEILDAHPHPLALNKNGPATQQDDSFSMGWGGLLRAIPLLLLLMVVLANETFRTRWFWARLLIRDPRKLWAIYWSRLVSQSRRYGDGPALGATPESWSAQSPQDEALASLAAEVSRARYSASVPSAPTPLQRQTFLDLERQRFRRQPRHRRILTSLFPWWHP